MSPKILKLGLIKAYREAYYQLTQEGRDRLFEKIGANEASVGAQGLITCYSRWSNEGSIAWTVIEYPNLQAVQKLVELHEKGDIWRYVDVETILGLPAGEEEPFEINMPDPIYQLFMVKNANNDLWEALTQDTKDRISAAVIESIEKHGGKFWRRASGDIEWSSEEYSYFGVIVWPSLEAQQAHFKDLVKIGWHRYVYAKTILGKKM